MFVRFFSGDVYEQRWWVSVFAIENLIQAIIREDWRDLVVLTDSDLITTIHERIEDPEFQRQTIAHDLDMTFVDDFLCRELSCIRSLLSDLEHNDSGDNIATLDPRFALDKEQLQNCIKLSVDFRNAISRPAT
jgi:hypothetical protein